jgi:hypothetical protein
LGLFIFILFYSSRGSSPLSVSPSPISSQASTPTPTRTANDPYPRDYSPYPPTYPVPGNSRDFSTYPGPGNNQDFKAYSSVYPLAPPLPPHLGNSLTRHPVEPTPLTHKSSNSAGVSFFLLIFLSFSLSKSNCRILSWKTSNRVKLAETRKTSTNARKYIITCSLVQFFVISLKLDL